MPELPEVETVRRGLVPCMEGRAIVAAQVNRPDLRRPLPPDLARRLSGRRVLALRRRAKYLLLDLSGGETLLLHLGMSGRILVSGLPAAQFRHPYPAPAKHDHMVLDMECGTRVTFNDARRFGTIDLLPTEGAESHPLLAGLGPEPLGNGFDGNYLGARLAGRRSPLKSVLLDQRLIAGLGNIYVCEALFRSGLSPLHPADGVTGAEVSALVRSIREVLAEAIEAGGSSLRDHRLPDGELGYFQHRFRVYGREDQPCIAPDCPGRIRRIVQSGRSSWYCPSCQK